MVNCCRSLKRTRLLVGHGTTAAICLAAAPRHAAGLPAVVLDNQGLVEEGHLDLIAGWQVQNLAAVVGRVEAEPIRHGLGLEHLVVGVEVLAAAALRPHRDLVPRLDQEGRDVGLPPVDDEVPVPDELPRLLARVGEAEAVDDVVEAALENLQQVVARHATPPHGLGEVLVELRLHHAVEAADLLLLPQLQAVLGRPAGAPLPVLARRKILGGLALGDRALWPVAARPLQIELHALAPAEPAHRARVSRHSVKMPPRIRAAPYRRGGTGHPPSTAGSRPALTLDAPALRRA